MDYTLTTQFNLNDEVYVIKDNKIQQGFVKDIDVHIIIQSDKSSKRVKYHIKKYYTGDSMGFYTANEIFKTKEELLKRLYEESN